MSSSSNAYEKREEGEEVKEEEVEEEEDTVTPDEQEVLARMKNYQGSHSFIKQQQIIQENRKKMDDENFKFQMLGVPVILNKKQVIASIAFLGLLIGYGTMKYFGKLSNGLPLEEDAGNLELE